jgi:DNA-binding transcriptional MerR regulator
VGDWTLAELADRAARALAEGGVRAPSGRVTEVPDPRLIRWYTTIGLLDRPTIGPGRIARYGQRHLLQLVAVKRLQAQGLPLAQIQQRLAGATDEQLRAVAALPVGFAADADAPSPPAGTGAAPPTPAGPGEGRKAARGASPERFWAARPATPGSPATAGSPDSAPSRASAKGPAGVDGDRDTVPRVYGVRLGGLTLLLPAEPAPHDLADIAAAARPLLDLLADRGLLDPDGGSRR